MFWYILNKTITIAHKSNKTHYKGFYKLENVSWVEGIKLDHNVHIYIWYHCPDFFYN